MIVDETFKGQDYTAKRLPKDAYENCIFDSCNFEGGYVDNQNFMECEFINCNLSNANLAHTLFNDVTFSHCKMMGLKFEACNDFLMNFSFNDCTLNLSSFYGMILKNQAFINCKLIEVDFTESELVNANFKNSVLDRAVFLQTNLQKADFTKAIHFSIDPEKNRLKNAKFSRNDLSGLLTKYALKIE